MHAHADSPIGAGMQVRLGISELYASHGDHVGHFYQSVTEWKDVAAPYLLAGLESGEKCVYFVSADRREVLRETLSAAGAPVDDVLASGQLVLDEGKSDPAQMQDALADALSEIPQKFPLLRWGGDMTWSLKKLPTSEKLMEWETHCNAIENPLAVFLCQYDLTAFLGSVVMDALKTHPVCVVGSVIHQNPYYLEPERFLEELENRRSPGLTK
jgi:hypothetical protein